MIELNSTTGEKALIITGSSDKYFNVGFDLDELIRKKDRVLSANLIVDLTEVLRRLIVFPLPTIAAINGHCYGGGVMLAMACDWRIMLNESGDFCLPEVLIGSNIPVGMREVFRIKMRPNVFRTAALTGKKYTCKQALEDKLIDEMVMHRQDLLQRAIEFGKSVAKYSKNRPNYKRIKYDMYYPIIDVMASIKRPSKL